MKSNFSVKSGNKMNSDGPVSFAAKSDGLDS